MEGSRVQSVVPRPTAAQLKRIAERRGMSVSAVICQAIFAELERERPGRTRVRRAVAEPLESAF